MIDVKYDHVELLARLAALYPLSDVLTWLNAPHRLLGHKPPLVVWEQGHHDEVLALIAQIEEGAYV